MKTKEKGRKSAKGGAPPKTENPHEIDNETLREALIAAGYEPEGQSALEMYRSLSDEITNR